MTGLGGEESPSRTYRYTWLQCPSVLAKAWVRALPPRCRGTGVLFRVIGPPPEYTATWRIAQCLPAEIGSFDLAIYSST